MRHSPQQPPQICVRSEEAREAEERRMDMRFALLCAVVANCHRNPKARRAHRIRSKTSCLAGRPRSREELLARIRGMCSSLKSS